ncbi:DUF4123 domain-containing protein [Jannaschia aquimarina]|uniref:DUF4123 domain-containing protein n=1 Tax=Jannaschia aquimarina TaxID=935700 RepID=UPI001BB0C78D|nr:DUF4123 domain-containing protein [Jannaschia aquimarina]
MTDPYDTDLSLYTIVDAGSVFGLQEVLASSALEHCCLFDNPETFDAAPWLVKLEPCHSLQLFSLNGRDAPGQLGPCDPGFLLQSGAPIDQLRKHLRKFTQQQVRGEDRRLFVRFWMPDAAHFYFDAVASNPDKTAAWFGTMIERIVAASDGMAMSWRLKVTGTGSASTASVRLDLNELEAFRQYRKVQFRRNMIAHFQKKAPDHAEAMGPEVLAEVVTRAIERARTYGFTRTSPAQLYIHLCLGLGVGFDRDPQHRWAQDILRDTIGDAWDQQTRADALRGGLIAYLARVNGRKGEHLAAFVKAVDAALSTFGPQVSCRETKAFLVAHFVTRTREIGDDTLDWLVEDTRTGCERLGLEEGRSVFVLTILRFVYGAECMRDPRFGWLHRCLYERPKAGTKDRALQTMFAKFMADSVALAGKAG